MRQTHNLILAALALVAAVSCNKVETPVAEGTPLTIRATLGTDEGTKVGYTPDGNILKTAWDPNETITVITVDGSGKVVTIDNFNYSGPGGKTVEFSGSLSSGATSDIRLLYPALEGSPYDGTYYGTSLPDGQTDDATRLIRGIAVGTPYVIFTENYFTQASSGDTNHLGKSVIYSGTGTVSGSELSVTVQPLSSVLRLDLKLPASAVGKQAKSAAFVAFELGSFGHYRFNTANNNVQFSFFEGADLPKAWNESRLYLGSWSGSTQTYMDIVGTDIMLYFPFVPSKNAVLGPSGGGSIGIALETEGISSPTKVITLTTDVNLESGKVYRMSVDLTS